MENKTILIVEDAVKATEILQLYLQREGYKTLAAHTGADVLVLSRARTLPSSFLTSEYKLLAAMAKALNYAFTRDQLISFALDDTFGDYDRTIGAYIMTLRAKIEDNRRKPRYTVTVHNTGYKFENHKT